MERKNSTGVNTACVSVYRLGELMAPGKPVNSIAPKSTSTITSFELSRWRGGRFACYAPAVMAKGRTFNCDFRFSHFYKLRKINMLQRSGLNFHSHQVEGCP